MTEFVSHYRPVADEDTAVGAALVRFSAGMIGVPRRVRPVIEESWQRCLRSGADPMRPRAPSRSGDPVRRSARNQELLEASAVMAQARTALSGCRTMLIFADAAAEVLRTDGDDDALAAAQSVGLIYGSNRVDVKVAGDRGRRPLIHAHHEG